MIEPVDPFRRCVFDRFKMAPGAATVDDLGLVSTEGWAPASAKRLE